MSQEDPGDCSMLEKRVKNLAKLLADFVAELQKDVRVDRVYLYGSYARNC